MTHCRPAALPPSALPIAGKATLVTEPSTKARLDARMQVASTQFGCEDVRAMRTEFDGPVKQTALCLRALHPQHEAVAGKVSGFGIAGRLVVRWIMQQVALAIQLEARG